MATLPEDDAGVPTSAQLINPAAPAPNSTEWSQYSVVADGGDIAFGKKADAAVTNPASTATAIAILKGMLTYLSTISGSGGAPASGALHAEDSPHVSGHGGNAVWAVRVDTASALADTSGDYIPFTTDSLARLRTVTKDEVSDASNVTTPALREQLSVKTTAGKLWGFQGYVDATASGYFQVHDKASAITNGNVPTISFPVLAGQSFSIELGKKGRAYASGIQTGWSTTGETFTSGGAHSWVDVQYE